jgi:sugar lactone lactonase YvrE
MRWGGLAAVAVLGLALTTAPSARATPLSVPDCPGAQAPRLIASVVGGLLENVLAGPDRLYVSDVLSGHVLSLTAPGATPTTLAQVPGAAGMAWAPDGSLVVGSIPLLPLVTGTSSVLRVDPHTGASSTIASALDGANGVTTAADGAIYTSTGESSAIDKIDPDGTVHRGWASVPSSNGLTLDPTGHYLYANQTFHQATVARVEVADPARVTTFASAPLLDSLAGPDGLTHDRSGTLYAAAYLAGQVWRIGPDGGICALARGLLLPAGIALGGGGAFPSDNLYVTTHSGLVYELPGAAG